MQHRIAGIAALLSLARALAQNQAPVFDAASVKPAAPGAQIVRGGGEPPWHEGVGRLHHAAISMRNLLVEAYGARPFQIAGPAWIDSQSYVVDAVMPPTTTRTQLRRMMQNLLADRFQLVVHRESKEQPVYSLVVSKDGPKMKLAVEGSPAPEPKGDEPEMDADGFPNPVYFPESRGGTLSFAVNGRSRIVGLQTSMQALADELTGRLSRPVTDETALPGHYDFVLNFASAGLGTPSGLHPPSPDAAGAPAPPPADAGARAPVTDLFAAIQSQLGLRLESKKGPVEMIVIDHAEKIPSGN